MKEEDKLNEAIGLLVIQDDTLKRKSTYYKSVDRPAVPVGPTFQAQQLPEWRPRNHRINEDGELKWLGTKVWPLPDEDLEINATDIGKGRDERCLCENGGSAECARMQISVGPTFQAQRLSEWRPRNHRNHDDVEELKWLGTKVWALPDEDPEVNAEDSGKGRNERCMGENVGSAECP
ncbi:hypothetical protein L6164_002200 [Bauhinia variegata]|uniref:Uncharacterized protein n=1 Tax=Bauhinia variegata TaxID=167791 RepID=A0ACB9PY03_BAUVA|nr:hypothetical protein L6164_002200 [Bauhinia variegata]